MKIGMKEDIGVADEMALLVLGSRTYLHVKRARTHLFAVYSG